MCCTLYKSTAYQIGLQDGFVGARVNLPLYWEVWINEATMGWHRGGHTEYKNTTRQEHLDYYRGYRNGRLARHYHLKRTVCGAYDVETAIQKLQELGKCSLSGRVVRPGCVVVETREVIKRKTKLSRRIAKEYLREADARGAGGERDDDDDTEPDGAP